MGFNKSHSLNSNFPFRLIAIPLVILLFSCSGKKSLFTQLTPEQTGINFINKNTDADSLSILDYLYYYNGGGVAIGDINNDGLPDIFFTSNRGGNKLYLNKGNMHFEDITDKAGVAGVNDWTTGVTMADVNGDGYLDIYVCAVSNHTPDNFIGRMIGNCTDIYIQIPVSIYICHGNACCPVIYSCNPCLISNIFKMHVAFIEIQFISSPVGSKENIRKAVIIDITYCHTAAIIIIQVIKNAQ